MTGDNHPIHYDEEYGKNTRFGHRLAHGLLLSSLTAVGASTLAPLIEHSIVAFVEQTTRFRAPVFLGDTIYPEHEIVGLDRSARGPSHTAGGATNQRTRSCSRASTAT
jgi:acyl dehydratase